MKPIDLKTVEHIMQLRKEGFTYGDISEITGVSHGTIARYAKGKAKKAKTRPRITEAQIKQMNDLLNKGMTKTKIAEELNVSMNSVIRNTPKNPKAVKAQKHVVTSDSDLTMDLLPDFLSGYLDGLSVRFNVPRSQIEDIVISRLETKIDHCSGWISLTWIFGGGLLLALLSHLS